MNDIKIFITDCDGVLTDAGMYYFSKGLEAKKFNTRDGMAFSILRKKEIKIGIITGEDNDIIKNRSEKLHMDFLYIGINKKEELLEEICRKYLVYRKNILYVGDDLNDLEIMKNVGFSCCPSDACQEIKEISDYICTKSGGNGVIREIVDKFFVQRVNYENDNLLNLFQIPNIVVKMPTIWLLKNSMINKEILYNAHLMVRYKTIQSYYANDEKWWGIYNKMQKIRVSQKSIIPREKAFNEQKFKDLINSIEKNGFDEKYPIIINRKFRLIDGSHRLAIALYFEIPYVPVIMNQETIDMDPEYSIKWFKKNGFDNIIDDIKNTYDEIVDRSEL